MGDFIYFPEIERILKKITLLFEKTIIYLFELESRFVIFPIILIVFIMFFIVILAMFCNILIVIYKKIKKVLFKHESK